MKTWPHVAAIDLGSNSFRLEVGRTEGGHIYVQVPEPETYAMLLAGLTLLGAVARRRKQAT